tara:strand:- start:3239 stop:3508 length:270 start_codon:yes stop_codon:yes gene_type:complete
MIIKLLGVNSMSKNKTYRINYFEYKKKQIDIVAISEDGALLAFDQSAFDPTRVRTIGETNKTLPRATVLDFDIFDEIDAMTNQYGSILK